MAFDFDNAIARLSLDDVALDSGASLENLAARYPELDFLFHKLEEQRAVIDAMVPASDLKGAQEDLYRAENAVTELTIRWQQASHMLGILLSMSAAKPISGELAQLAKFASDAVIYGEACEA